MPKNMMNKNHKATNKKYRDGYDEIRWEKEKTTSKKKKSV